MLRTFIDNGRRVCRNALTAFLTDLRHAVRQLRRAPGFAALAMLCLGLGIGVNIAIFGVINAVLLRPLPVVEPQRLLLVTRSDGVAPSYTTYREMAARSRTLSGLAAALPMESDVDVDGESDFVVAEAVTANYGAVVGVTPTLGRWFVNDGEPAALISHALWERRFNRSATAIGRIIRSESESYTIVGIAPRDFVGGFAPLRTDIWVPVRSRSRLMAQLERGELSRMLMLFGRLRAATNAAQASLELDGIDRQLRADRGIRERVMPIVARTIQGTPNSASRSILLRLSTLLATVVGLVLLIACVNVGNLLLARGTLRRGELAVRRALGASRPRMVGQLLSETLILALGGGVCGVVLAVWTNRLLEATFPATFSIFALQLDLSLDWRTLVFAMLASLVTTALCGLLPAWRASRVRGLAAFNAQIDSGAKRSRAIALVGQVVMSLVLLFVAGSFLDALRQLQSTDPGFNPAGRLYAYTWAPASAKATAADTPSASTAEWRRELYAQALARVRAMPGVRSAALAASVPLMPVASDCASLPGSASVQTTTSAVDAGYFTTMGIGIAAGREFSADDDVTDAVPTVVISESLARRLWQGKPPIGERVLTGCDRTQPALVIGVARDSAIRAVAEPGQPHIYRRFAPQIADGLTAILIDTIDPAGMVQPVRRALLALGQGIRVYTVQPLATHVDQSYAEVRWLAQVLSAVGVLALLLAGVGLYGMVAYRVASRTREIGVRMALGATRRDVFREVMVHAMAIVLAGVAIGEVVTAAVTGVAAAVQEGVRPAGLVTHLVIAAIWLVVSLLASYAPAARASRVDPLVALRYE